jgi:hypothetical protein
MGALFQRPQMGWPYKKWRLESYGFKRNAVKARIEYRKIYSEYGDNSQLIHVPDGYCFATVRVKTLGGCSAQCEGESRIAE